ncbi:MULTISPECIES: helix-turn-helix transcriptional regulator [unclassified Janthinobacterium]|uniref:helix-turn-helix domain-containing protein n=1 Tax=unclassified Janthinobacterium TaxID=2610881 RepID=UPI00160F2316|nr:MULTISPECIES: helix-turn-helix transcriptional regulator [unclassified Janthinobacterium]MBB5610570.1 transcriptional regulator with XRE-family HTH domain [Janthinobacterium sp. S3T4]MBB5615976.1 transcriptional regulator with XRE-family HTH domain [Janthinobacterium sp. S3M3]
MTKYENDSTVEFSKRLAAALERKNGGNQSDLARNVNCTPQAVNKWLAGSQFPRDRILRVVADYLGVTPEYLKFGTPNEPPPPPPPKFFLMYLQADEAEFITHVRELSETGRKQLRASLINAEKLPPEALPHKANGTH